MTVSTTMNRLYDRIEGTEFRSSISAASAPFHVGEYSLADFVHPERASSETRPECSPDSSPKSRKCHSPSDIPAKYTTEMFTETWGPLFPIGCS